MPKNELNGPGAETVQKLLKVIVADYKKTFAAEFELFKKAVRQKRENQRTDFGETGMDFAERILFEVPETLHAMIFRRLTKEQLRYYDSKEGAKWFVKTFPDFQVTRKV